MARTAKYLSLVLASLVVLIPLVVVLFAALKTHAEYNSTGPLTPPRNWLNLDNFVTAWTAGNMLRGFWNTTIILVVSLTGTVLIGTLAAYAVSRFTFGFKRLVLGLFLVAALVPGVTTQVATYQIVKSMGLVNTQWSAIVLFLGTDIVSIYIFMQFMQSIPRSLDQAAMIDGASRFTVYRRIILPLMKLSHRHRGDHQGHRHLQRVLHPVPLHAIARPQRHLDRAVPLQGPVRRAVGGDRRLHDDRPPADCRDLPAAPALHLQRHHRRSHQMTKDVHMPQTRDLGGSWELRADGALPEQARSLAGVAVPAVVPGCVHVDLLNDG
nr:hypothetical protein GCM10020092_071020 [Actinoplanes digitatis]